MRIYLDTSIPSTYFDDRTPDRQEVTRDFWARASSQDDLFASGLVLAELEQTPSEEKRHRMRNLIAPLKRLAITPEALRLARVLHQGQLVPANKLDDAIHLALAAVEGMDAVVSWNFRHMVNLKVKQNLPAILAREGYFRQFQIIAPYEYTWEIGEDG